MIDWSNFSGFFSTGIPSEVLYTSFIITTILLMVGLVWRWVRYKKKYVLLVLLAEYVFIVVCSTVVLRPHISIARWEFMPFWTYKAVINHTPGVKVWDIVLNVILFMPLGVLVKLLIPKINIGKMVLIAGLCSLSIEMLQYLYSKGISQTDDIMHNVIGAAFGWLLATGAMSIWSQLKLSKN